MCVCVYKITHTLPYYVLNPPRTPTTKPRTRTPILTLVPSMAPEGFDRALPYPGLLEPYEEIEAHFISLTDVS